QDQENTAQSSVVRSVLVFRASAIIRHLFYVARRLSVCYLESNHEGLQGPLSEHVVRCFVVFAESTGDDAGPNLRFFESLSESIHSNLPDIYTLWVGAVQLLFHGVDEHHN